MLNALSKDESGQGVPEYALIIAFVVVMVVIATILFQDAVVGVIQDIRVYVSSSVI